MWSRSRTRVQGDNLLWQGLSYLNQNSEILPFHLGQWGVLLVSSMIVYHRSFDNTIRLRVYATPVPQIDLYNNNTANFSWWLMYTDVRVFNINASTLDSLHVNSRHTGNLISTHAGIFREDHVCCALSGTFHRLYSSHRPFKTFVSISIRGTQFWFLSTMLKSAFLCSWTFSQTTLTVHITCRTLWRGLS